MQFRAEARSDPGHAAARSDRRGTEPDVHRYHFSPLLASYCFHPHLFISFAAFEPVSRTYFAIAGVTGGALQLWATTLNGAVNTSTPLSPSGGVTVTGAETNQALQGLETLLIGGVAQVVAVFQDGDVYTVDPVTGAATLLVSVLNTTERLVTQAITVDPVQGLLFAITESPTVTPARAVVTVDLASGAFKTVPLQPLKQHLPDSETPFEMTWLPAMQQLLVFYTGGFDQVYVAIWSSAARFVAWGAREGGDCIYFFIFY
jgi:hypothetical protein